MKIAILSDTHNYLPGIQTALNQLQREKVDTIIHCGDMTLAETVDAFRDYTIYHVWGNGDLDTLAIHFAIQECQAGSSTSEIYTDVLGGKRIAAIHGHNTHLLQTIIENGHFDYVFHGHTHRRRDDEIGGTRVINPGAIGGAFRSSRSFCILNLENNDLNYYPVG